jgi:hypothetical protein
LDLGISEESYWNMTIAELERAVKSKKRVLRQQQEAEAKTRASFDYILADLVGRSVARIYSNSVVIPPISEVYPTLFDSKEIEEMKAQKQDELSALRFRQFAQSFNKRFLGGANKG